MQSGTNGLNLSRKQIALGVVVLLVFGVLALFFLQGDNSDEFVVDDAFLNSYTDPITGETITNATGKTEENFGENIDKPVLLGFKELLYNGFTQAQLDILIELIGEFSINYSFSPKEISVFPDSVKFTDPEPGSLNLDTVEFKMRLARENDVTAVVERKSLTEISLQIRDDTATLFQSEFIDYDLLN